MEKSGELGAYLNLYAYLYFDIPLFMSDALRKFTAWYDKVNVNTMHAARLDVTYKPSCGEESMTSDKPFVQGEDHRVDIPKMVCFCHVHLLGARILEANISLKPSARVTPTMQVVMSGQTCRAR